MARTVVAAFLFFRLLAGQTADERWKALSFLEGTWSAKTTRGSTSGIEASGTYTFRKDVGGHVLVRLAKVAGCKAPAGADCDHTDILYVYQERAVEPLKAIYFDNEGHVIHYDVSCPAAGSAVFLSEPGVAGPQFRLTYELKGAVMEGKFQMRMPGKAEWTSYLEWNGTKQ